MQNDWQKWKMPIFTIVPRHAAAVSLGNHLFASRESQLHL